MKALTLTQPWATLMALQSENLLLDRAPELHERLEQMRRELLAKQDRARERELKKVTR